MATSPGALGPGSAGAAALAGAPRGAAAPPTLSPPSPFPHPYTPYPSQASFMRCVYTAATQRKVAVLESPTGTGKTLSLLVGALHWLREVQSRQDTMDEAACSGGSSSSSAPALPPTAAPASPAAPTTASSGSIWGSSSAAAAWAAPSSSSSLPPTPSLWRSGGGGSGGSSAARAAPSIWTTSPAVPAPSLHRTTLPADEPLWAAAHDAEVAAREAATRFKLRAALHTSVNAFLRSYRLPRTSGSNSNSSGFAPLPAPPAAVAPETAAATSGGSGDDGKEAESEDDGAWLLTADFEEEGDASQGNAVAALADALRRDREGEDALAGGVTASPAPVAAAAATTTLATSPAEFEALLADFARKLPPPLRVSAAGSGDGTEDPSPPASSSSSPAALPYVRPKVFFVSRTHSQLSQFVRELAKTVFGGASSEGDPVRLVPLGSRKNLCIHGPVANLGSDVRMAEACAELLEAGGKGSKQEQEGKDGEDGAEPAAKRRKSGCTGGRGSSKETKGCPYMPPGGAAAQARFRNLLLAAAPGPDTSASVTSPVVLRDIEAAAELGRALRTCPYYGTRAAMPLAEVVTLPYSLLLSAKARAAVGIDLRDCLVIIDEAHNLVDAVNASSSAALSGPQAASALAQVKAYLARYHARLSPSNLVLCTQFKDALAGLVKHLTTEAAAPRLSEGGGGGSDKSAPSQPLLVGPTPRPRATMHTPVEYLCAARLDHLNLHRLVRFVEGSGLLRKLRGFAEAGLADLSIPPAAPPAEGGPAPQQQQQQQQSVMAAVTAMRSAFSFLHALCVADGDGRVVLDRGSAAPAAADAEAPITSPLLRFVSLNAGKAFEEVANQARGVILAGGTLAPVDPMLSQLLPRTPPSRILKASFPHVVDPGNVAAFAVKRGPTSKVLDFRHANRRSPALMDELGAAIVNLSAVVPHGLVVFLPSYQDEAALLAHWAKPREGTGSAQPPPPTLLAQMQRRKPVFREPRDAADLEGVLRSYAAAAASPTGALLFSVVGGKMSEGINFSDDLARCVVVVGLPYPNAGDPELQERMAFLDRTQAPPAAGSSSGATPGREYYEALCMRAVNQSIGRAIRHIGDHAAIVLLDERYATPRIRGKLPGWIEQRLEVADGWGGVSVGLGRFYAGKRAAAAAAAGGGSSV